MVGENQFSETLSEREINALKEQTACSSQLAKPRL
jgi:hypothetical protein